MPPEPSCAPVIIFVFWAWVLSPLEAEVKRLEAAITALLEAVFGPVYALLTQVPGVGPVTVGDPAGGTARTGASEREADCGAGERLVG